MQLRPYPNDDGWRVWLSRRERERLLDVYRDERPKRLLALQLGLHGLRSEEVTQVAREHFRPLDLEDADGYKLIIPDGKRGMRECPVSREVRNTATVLSNAADLRKDDPLIGVTTKTLRDWIQTAREDVLEDVDEPRLQEGWTNLGMHDLRRTWATDTFYALAMAGVPIAEQLTMGWGGWVQNESGRQTFRENYLGPEPDHVALETMQHLSLG